MYTADTSKNPSATDKQIEYIKTLISGAIEAPKMWQERGFGDGQIHKSDTCYATIRSELRDIEFKNIPPRLDNSAAHKFENDVIVPAAMEWIAAGCPLPLDKFSKARASWLISWLKDESIGLIEIFALTHTEILEAVR